MKFILIWLVFPGVAAFAAWWHIRENRQLARQWRERFDAQSAEWLTRFAWMRTFQLLLVLLGTILLIIVYDWKLTEARRSLSAHKAQLASRPPAQPLSVEQPVELATAAPVPGVPPQTDSVAEIYNPDTGKQSVLDTMKKRYEDLLVTYFFLRKCGKAEAADYHIIVSALAQEMASVDAPGRMQSDVLTAAQGSYKEMYAGSPCGDAAAQLQAQYKSYIATLSRNYLAP